jgi:hypothetical protein
VTVHGFKSEDTLWLNGQEGVCERWDKTAGLLSVRLYSGGAPKKIKPVHLRKLRMHDDDSMQPEVRRALEIFQKWDEDGDGLMALSEFEQVLANLGMRKAVLEHFANQVDRNHDNFVSYDEFIAWSLSPVDTKKLKLDAYWPEDGGIPDIEKERREDTVSHPEEVSHDTEMTREELEQIVGPLPKEWPKHGMAAVNNVRMRFPDYPLPDVVKMMAENNYMGGKTIAAIRKSGAKENEAVRAGKLN